MVESANSFWFYAKSYGWGWFLPARWQGWVTYAAYTAILLGGRNVISASRDRTIFTITVTTLLVAIIIWKGERPLRWRWDGD